MLQGDAFLRNMLYHFDFIGDRLRIGRFCALGAGTRFLMNGGNHRTTAPSTHPFVTFGGGWSGRFDGEADFPTRGDTTIGNDVWTACHLPDMLRVALSIKEGLLTPPTIPCRLGTYSRKNPLCSAGRSAPASCSATSPIRSCKPPSRRR